MGFDNRDTLGNKETGAAAALPIWIDFMRTAIAGKPDEQFPSDEDAVAEDRANNGAPSASGRDRSYIPAAAGTAAFAAKTQSSPAAR